MGAQRAAHDADDDESSLEASARELAQVIERHFERWIAGTEGLESPQAQMVVFTMASKRLAAGGVGVTPLIKQLLRTYGLETLEIEIEDGLTGETLVRKSTAMLAPGSRRKDN